MRSVVVTSAVLATALVAGPSASPQRDTPRLLRGLDRVALPEDRSASEQCSIRPLKLPTGAPAMLSCRDARRIIAEARARLATPPGRVAPRAFAEDTSGWLDPHGLWSASPDAPARSLVAKHAQELISEIEEPSRGDSECAASARIAEVLQSWVERLQKAYDAAPKQAPDATTAFTLASSSIYQDDPVTRPALALARDLGARAKGFAHFFPTQADAPATLAARVLPKLSRSQWQAVVLAAAVRAYVPAVDPHGQWAPLDEEWSLYAADSALDFGPRLWQRMLRTALGVVAVEATTPPLEDGDLVLSIGGIATAGLSVEQTEQLSRLEPVGGEAIRDVVVLRPGETAPRMLRIALSEPEPAEPAELPFSVETVRHGDGAVAVISLSDVPDSLGEDLGRWVAEERQSGELPHAILLDLRGNGGGSIDGAAGALGVFVPGVPSFPLRRRGGHIEVQYSGRPHIASRWTGPVATLVDGYTASAAEMIAGGLSAYKRGPILGTETFGKGCVQEYFDDRSGIGVLRLTTMVFSLPDGSPLQGRGLRPEFALPVAAPREREGALPGAAPPWEGPDVRVLTALGGAAWPGHAGQLGPCEDPVVCQALRRLGQEPTRSPRAAARAGAPGPRRATR